MTKRACVFIDGENLRHSLVDMFEDDGLFSNANYLPSKADWTKFYDWIVAEATNNEAARLRAYWFTIDEVDFYPYGLKKLINERKIQTVVDLLSQHKPFKDKLNGLHDSGLVEELKKIDENLQSERMQFQNRFNGWKTVQNGISLKHRSIEFRRAGAILYNLFQKKLGKEKAVDVRLACDAIMLRDIYEFAIIVSGDQDYVPAAQILKDSGKTVINVAFLKRNGELLPGGARRLNLATDSSLEIPYDTLKGMMGL
jgi:uncharacterized LabA/DUF88 family protein